MLFLKSFKRYTNKNSLTKCVDYCQGSLSLDKPKVSSFGRAPLCSLGIDKTWGLRPSWLQKSRALIFKASARQTSSNFDFSLSASSVDRTKKCFWNQTFDKGRLKNFVLWFFLKYGEHKTVRLVEELKTIGFQYATKAGISLGVEDLKIPPKKAALINEAESLSIATIQQFKRGEITEVERFQRLIDTWHRTSEQLKVEVIENFEGTDVLNPVYMMAFSGARGNISQVRQLVGMRGLMSNPQGQIIDFPIRSNFREGLTLTEYIISSYGARKGIVDTALRTANAGYLTRRLVDVAQHVIISSTDCGTTRGIFLNDMKEGKKTIYSLQNRLVGRVLACDIYSQESPTSTKRIKIASKNTEISSDLATLISQHHKKVFVRSPLTCQTNKLVCQLCYGWSLAQGNLVSIGEAVGIVAAQSIGEPGTQLTMRTFHTGGVFAGNISDQIKAPFDGFVIYKNPIAGKLIRTPEGKIAFLTKDEGSFSVYKLPTNVPFNTTAGDTIDGKNRASQNFSPKLTNLDTLEKRNFKIPFYTLLFLRNGEKVFYKQVIAQISAINRQKTATDQAEFTIKAEISGLFYSKNLEIEETKVGPMSMPFGHRHSIKDNQASAMSEEQKESLLDTINRAWSWGYAWILAGKIYQLPLPSSFFPILGDFVSKTSLMNCVNWYMPNSFGSGFKLNRPLNFSLFNTNSFKLMRKVTLLGSSRQNKVSKQVFSLSGLSSATNRAKVSNTSLIEKDFKLLKADLISFELSKITYKNIGYFLKLSKPICTTVLQQQNLIQSSPYFGLGSSNMELSREVSKFNHNVFFGGVTSQNSILSHQDNLFLFSSLFPRNRFFNAVKTNKSLQTNTRNPLINPSTWEPSFNVFLNWFPKRFFTPTAGLIFFDTNGNKATQQQKTSFTGLPFLMSVVWPCKTINEKGFYSLCFRSAERKAFFNSSGKNQQAFLSMPKEQQPYKFVQTSMSTSFESRRNNMSTFIVSKNNLHGSSLDIASRNVGLKETTNIANSSNIGKMRSIYIEHSIDRAKTKLIENVKNQCSLDKALGCPPGIALKKHASRVFLNASRFFSFPTFFKKELLEQTNKGLAASQPAGSKQRATKLNLNKTNSLGQSPSKNTKKLNISSRGPSGLDVALPESLKIRTQTYSIDPLTTHPDSQDELAFKKTLNKNLELNSLLQTFIYEQYPKNLLGCLNHSLCPSGIDIALKSTKIGSEGAKSLGYSWKNGFKFNWGLNLLGHKIPHKKRTENFNKTGFTGQQSGQLGSRIKQRVFWVPQPFYKIRDKNNSIILIKAEQDMLSCGEAAGSHQDYKGYVEARRASTIDKQKFSKHLVFIQSNRQGKTRLIELNGNCAQLIFINNKVNGVCLNAKAKDSNYKTFIKPSTPKGHNHLSSFVKCETKPQVNDQSKLTAAFKKEGFYKLPTNFGIFLGAQQEKLLPGGLRPCLVKRKYNFVTQSLANKQTKSMTLKAYCKENSMIRSFVADGPYFLPKRIQNVLFMQERNKLDFKNQSICLFPSGKDIASRNNKKQYKPRNLFNFYCHSLFYKKSKRKYDLKLNFAQAKLYEASTKKPRLYPNGIDTIPFLCSPYLQNQLEQKVNNSKIVTLMPEGSKQNSQQSIDNFLYPTLSGIFKQKVKSEMFQRVENVQKCYKKALSIVTSIPFGRRQNISFRPKKLKQWSKKMSPQQATFKNKKTNNLGLKRLNSAKTLSQLLKMDKAQLFLEKTRLFKGNTKREQEKYNNINITSMPKDNRLHHALTKQETNINKKKSLQNLLVAMSKKKREAFKKTREACFFKAMPGGQHHNIKTHSEEETNINLWLTNGYFYYTTDLTKFFLYNKKIIQPGTNIDSHFSFDKNPVYLEIIPLKKVCLDQGPSCQQKSLVTDLLLETKFSTSSANPNFISKKPEPLSISEGDNLKVIQGHIALNKKVVIKEQEWLKSFQKDNKITIIKEIKPNLDDKSQSKKIIELDFSQTILNKNSRFKIEKRQQNKDSQPQSILTRNINVTSMSKEHKQTNYIILIRKAFEYQFVKEVEYKKDIYSLRLGQNPSWQQCCPAKLKLNKISQNRAKHNKVKTSEHRKAYLIFQTRKLKRKMLNQSFHSIRLYSNYQTGLLNKQKTTGKNLSKYGSSQLKIIFNNSLYPKNMDYFLKNSNLQKETKTHAMSKKKREAFFFKQNHPQHSSGQTVMHKGHRLQGINKLQDYNSVGSGEVRDMVKFDSKGIDFNQNSHAEMQNSLLKERKTNNFTMLKNNSLFDKVRILGHPSLMMTSLKSINLSPFIISYKAPYSINFPFKTPMCFFSQQYQPSFIFNNPWDLVNKTASMGFAPSNKTKIDNLKTFQTIIPKTRYKRLKSLEYTTLKQLLSNYIYKINNLFSKSFVSAMPFAISKKKREAFKKTREACFFKAMPGGQHAHNKAAWSQGNFKPNLFEVGKNFSNLSSIFLSPIVEYSLVNEFPKSIPGSILDMSDVRNQQSFSTKSSPLDIQIFAILNNRYLRKQNLFLNNSNNKKFLFGRNGPLLGSLASGSPTSNNSFSRFTQPNEELALTIKKALYKTDFVSYIDNSVNSQIPIMKTYAYSSIKGELIYQKKPLTKMAVESSAYGESPYLYPLDIDGILGLSKQGTKTQQSTSLTSNKLIRQKFTDFFLSTKPVDHVEYGCMVLTKNDQVCYNLSPSRRQEVFSGKQIKPFNQNYKEIYYSLENQKKENQYFINNIVINLLNLLITETKPDAEPQQSSELLSQPEGQKQNIDKTSKTEDSGDSSKFEIDELFSGFLSLGPLGIDEATEFTNNLGSSESMPFGHRHSIDRENELNIKTTKSMLAKSGTLELNKIPAGLAQQRSKLLIGEFLVYGDKINPAFAITKSGQIIHINNYKVTLRKGQPIFVSPQAILHKYDGDFIDEQTSVITLAYQQLKTGDIVQGIPKIEQFFEARTTKRGRLFRDSLENLLKAIFNRYNTKLPRDQAVRQSFYKIQQIIIDGVQRVYRSQGVTIADKHLEVIVKQMTSKVRITFGGTTGYLPGELCDLYDIELINKDIRPKILYEPIVLGITKASLEVKSFLSAASFQQTTRVLTKAALSRKTDYLNGLKENVILGNLIPAGTGYLVYLDKYSTHH